LPRSAALAPRPVGGRPTRPIGSNAVRWMTCAGRSHVQAHAPDHGSASAGSFVVRQALGSAGELPDGCRVRMNICMP
jgi:hypothetical protein